MRSVKTDVCNMGPCKRWREQGIRQARHSFHARNGTHNNIFPPPKWKWNKASGSKLVLLQETDFTSAFKM